MSKAQQWEVHLNNGTVQVVNGDYAGMNPEGVAYEFERLATPGNPGPFPDYDTVAVFPLGSVHYMIRCLEPEEAGDE